MTSFELSRSSIKQVLLVMTQALTFHLIEDFQIPKIKSIASPM
jgi:hypothetical protein